MIIKLFDKTEFEVSQEQAELIKRAITEGEPSIEIKDKWFRTSAIATIMPGGKTEADIPIERRLAPPDYRGQPSVAKEKLRRQIESMRSK